MPLYPATVWFDLHQILGGDFDARRTKAYVTTNVENGTLIDTETGEIRMGDQTVTINADGTGEFTTWSPLGGTGNPLTWQTSLIVDYARTGRRDRAQRTFGPYTIEETFRNVTNKALTSNVATITVDEPHGLRVGDTVTVYDVDSTFNGFYTVAAVPSTTSLSYAKTASNVASVAATGTIGSEYVSLALLEDEQAIPPNYQTAFTESMEEIRDDAQAAADEAEANINGLGIGTVTTGAAGSSADVTLTGTAPDRDFNFTIPRGDQGLPGPGAAAWTASQAVVVGSVRQAPDGSWIKSTAARTTGSTFDATEQGFWATVSATTGTMEQVALTDSMAEHEPRTSFTLAGKPIEADVSDSKVFLCTLDGVAYARGTVATTTLYSSIDDCATWTTVEVFAGSALVGVYDTFDGEVIVVGGKNVFKSAGWSTNPVTATWTDVCQSSFDDAGFAQAQFIPSDVDTWGQYVLLGEYVVPRNNSRRVRLSTDHGATFTTVMDLNTLHPGEEANTHIHGVGIDGFKAGTPRLWMTYGDGPRGVRYSDNLGVSWTTMTGTDPDPSLVNMMTITATEYGMVLSTDSNAPDGIFRILRTDNPADMTFELIEGIPYEYAAGSLLGFGTRAWRDPDTGWVYITFNTKTPAAGTVNLPGYLFVSDGISATLVWSTSRTAATANSIYPDGVGVTASGKTFVAYVDGAGAQVRASMKIRRGLTRPAAADAMGASTLGRESFARGYRAFAGNQSVAVGTQARTGASVAANYRGVAVGNFAKTGTDGVTVGYGAGSESYNYCTAVGSGALPSDAEGTAVGYAALTGLQSVAIGKGAQANVQQAVAIGKDAKATQNSGIAIGIGAQAGGTSGAVAIGNLTVSGQGAIGIGNFNTQAGAVDGIAIGRGAKANTNTGAVAIGRNATSTHQDSVALGNGATTTANNQVQIGTKHLAMKEVADPGVAGTDGARLFAVDNGAGKTQLVVRFQTGSAIVLATEA